MWAEEFMSSEAYQPNVDQLRIAPPGPSVTARPEGAACEGPVSTSTVAPSGHAQRLASWLLEALASSTAPEAPPVLVGCALRALADPTAGVPAPAHLGAPPLPPPHTPRRTRADAPCPVWRREVLQAWRGEARRGAEARAALHVLHCQARHYTAARHATRHHTRVQLLRAVAWMRTLARQRGGVEAWRGRRASRGALGTWRVYRNSTTHWAILVTHLRHRHDRAAGSTVLKAWRQHVRLRPLEEQLLSRVHTGCLRQSWAHWGSALVTQRSQQRQLLAKALSAWTTALRLAVKTRALQRDTHRRAKATALHQWRAELVQRRRVVQLRVWEHWRDWAGRAHHRRSKAFTALALHAHTRRGKRQAQAMHRSVCLVKALGQWGRGVGRGRARRQAQAWATTRAKHRATLTWVLYTHTYTTQLAHAARAVQWRRAKGMRQALHVMGEGRVRGQGHRGALHTATRGHDSRRLSEALHLLATHARQQARGRTLQQQSRHRALAALWEHWTHAYTHSHTKALTHRCVLAWRGGLATRQWGRQWLRQWHKATQVHQAIKDTATLALAAWRALTANKAARRGVAFARGEQRDREVRGRVLQQWAQRTRHLKALTTHAQTQHMARTLRHWARDTTRRSRDGLCLWRAEVWHETKQTTTLLRYWHHHARTRVLHRWLLGFGTQRLRPRQCLRLLATCVEGWKVVVQESRRLEWALARAHRWATHTHLHKAIHRWLHVVVARQVRQSSTSGPAPSLLTATRACHRRLAQHALARLRDRVHQARALQARARVAYAAVVAQLPLAAHQALTLRVQARRRSLSTHLHAWRHATLLGRLHTRRRRDMGAENRAGLSNLAVPPPSTYTSLHKHKAAHARPQPHRQSPFKPAPSTPLQASASRLPDRPALASLSRSHPMPGLRSSSYAQAPPHPALHYTRRASPL